MSGLVSVTYMSLPIICLKIVGSTRESFVIRVRFELTSTGIVLGLEPSMSYSSNNSSTYFLCEIIIPLLDLTSLSPRKNYKQPKSLSLK